MSSKKFGYGALALGIAAAWVVGQAETENPGTVNRGTGSGTQVIAGIVKDGRVLLDEARTTVGGLATDLGGAVEGTPPTSAPLPLQVQPTPQG